MTITQHVRHHADLQPCKPAIITSHGLTLTYHELYQHMTVCAPLPIPLLGSSWDGDFILRTTGTTGKSKEVVISQRAVLANSENLIEGHGYTERTFFIVTGPLDHLGCWSKIFPTLMTGGTLYIMDDGMKHLDSFFQAFTVSDSVRHATFLVPSSIRILLMHAADRLQSLSAKLDFIESGGAPLPQPDMLRLCSLLPHTRLYNTYASTETGVCTTYNYNDGRCLSGCLGKPLRHSSVFITPEGTIACKGSTLMSGYRGDPEQTAAVMHDGAFYTADGGWIDDEGMLHIEGRRDDIINTGGLKVAPQEVEEVALSFPGISECICTSRPHPILGAAPALLVVPAPGHTLDKRALARHIAATLERYKVPLHYETVASIAKTPNGKPDRKAYRNSAQP